ncbi:hypothetical protein [Halococcus saccharolyticus]|uniref:Photosynthesis system II assembly factor Ycf48/Hcf136-like domain-containing protein n=1 Tax=Halococcus saccharolyticus DSM 5350 TaxID=1227455 RepID=M0MFK0_9EURY|nr:hypothetical protein [Halococcus saccharolyticus]EMA44476.1 hypothetical protein C449_10356 [Halococcus saccharolyticus DSM 5350]
MSASSAESRGFFAYYREYARSGVHGASAAALTAFGLIASYTGNRAFILLAIAVYVLPPIFLYLTGEGERVPSVVDDESTDGAADGNEPEHDRPSESPEAATEDESADQRGSADADSATTQTGADANADVSDPTTADSSGTDPAETDPADAAEADSTDSGLGPDETSSDSGSLADDIGAADATGDEDGWTTVETPTDEPLTGVVATHDGVFVVGENGVVLARGADGWEIVLEHGPSADDQSLRDVDATDDGRAIWFAGDGGALGRYDVEESHLTDHSAPEDQTSTWTAIAIVDSTGEEHVHLANGSGEVLRGTYDDGDVDWGEIHKPGSGSSITDLAFDTDVGYACDSSQGVYATTDGGASYETIGIEDANTDFAALAATDAELVVAGGDGTVFRYDGSVWTTLRAGETALRAIDLTDETGLAAGDAGDVFEHADGGWEAVETPTDADLRGILVGAARRGRPDVAVGADGTIVERDRN